MAFRLEIAVEAERDFGLIFDHLLENYIGFGEGVESAIKHAEARVMEIRAAADRILTAAYRGVRHDDFLPGLRRLTINRAIYWFDVEEENESVRLLAVFFGGQDYVRHMMARLLES